MLATGRNRAVLLAVQDTRWNGQEIDSVPNLQASIRPNFRNTAAALQWLSPNWDLGRVQIKCKEEPLKHNAQRP